MKSNLIRLRRATNHDTRGSLSLEHVLYIGAIIAMFAAVGAFYGRIANYFNSIDFEDAPSVTPTENVNS